jgi:class 3 adenylate cyclase
MRRQLAAILFADIAGFARLMDAYEAETYPRLMALFKEVIDPTVDSEAGRIVKIPATGFSHASPVSMLRSGRQPGFNRRWGAGRLNTRPTNASSFAWACTQAISWSRNTMFTARG